MAVLFWYLVKRDAYLRYCTVAYNEQVTFYKIPEQHSHVNCVHTVSLRHFHIFRQLLFKLFILWMHIHCTNLAVYPTYGYTANIFARYWILSKYWISGQL